MSFGTRYLGLRRMPQRCFRFVCTPRPSTERQCSLSSLSRSFWRLRCHCRRRIIALTIVSSAVNKVNRDTKSTINMGVNKVNAAFTNVNATAPKFGGGVSLFFRCAAPTVTSDSWSESSISGSKTVEFYSPKRGRYRLGCFFRCFRYEPLSE